MDNFIEMLPDRNSYQRLLSNVGLRFSVVEAYRNYTAQLNWKCPRGHKIGWRNLTRHQKRCAILKAVLELDVRP